MRMTTGQRHQTGISFLEVLIAIVIIGLTLAGTLPVFIQTQAQSIDPVMEQQAVAIAEAYLEEILLKDYVDPDSLAICPAPEGNRSLYDNLCDYDGLDEQPPRDQSGGAISGLDNYRVRVTVDQGASLNGLAGPAQTLRVDVRVSHASGEVDFTLGAYRTNHP